MSAKAVQARRRGLGGAGWLFVAVSLGFVAILLFRQGGELPRLRAELSAFGWELRPGWLVAALAVGTGNLFLMGAIWVALFRSLGGQVGAGEGMRVWMVTNLGRYIPGKIWQLTGLAAHMRRTREAGAAALTAAGMFQVLVLGTGVVTAVATLGARFLTGGALLPTVGILVLLTLILLRPTVAGRLAAALAARLGEPATGAEPRREVVWGCTVGLLAAWLVYGIGLWCVWRGAGGATDPGPLTMAGVYSAAYVAGYVVLFAPGGLVVREGAMAGLLAATTGVPVAVGAAVAVLARLWAIATELLGVAIAGALGRSRATDDATVGATWDGERIDRSGK